MKERKIARPRRNASFQCAAIVDGISVNDNASNPAVGGFPRSQALSRPLRKRLVLRRNRFRFLERDALLLLVRKIRHVDRDRRAVPNFRCGVRSATRANAIDPVLHVILIWRLALHRLAGGAVGFFRPILNGLFQMVLDSSIAAENAVAALVVTVAERGLPGLTTISF